MSYLVVPALAARYAGGKLREYFSLQKWYGLCVLATTGLFALAVRLLGRPVIHSLYAGKFDDLTPLLYVLAFWPLVMGLGNTMSMGASAAEKPKLVFYAYLCSGAATLLVGIPLLTHFGLRGAVYGMVLSAAAYSLALGVGYFLVVYRGSYRWSMS
jgi:O-antigen/teichoic acid export membrane protein